MQQMIEPNISAIEAEIAQAGFQKRSVFLPGKEALVGSGIHTDLWIHPEQPHIALLVIRQPAVVIDVWQNRIITNSAVGMLRLPDNDIFHLFPDAMSTIDAWRRIRGKNWCRAPENGHAFAHFVVDDLTDAWRLYWAIRNAQPAEA